jgi:hypothetical protein
MVVESSINSFMKVVVVSIVVVVFAVGVVAVFLVVYSIVFHGTIIIYSESRMIWTRMLS